MAFEKSAEVVVGMVPKDRINQAKEPASSVLWREESQQMIAEQKSQTISPEVRGEAGSQSAQIEEQQSPQAQEQVRALRQNLMEEISAENNLNQAVYRVRSNKGSPGVDGMNVGELEGWMKINRHKLERSLLEGTYRPQPVRAVEIPKPDGGVRELGIPTVIDRVVQQAILQVLNPILDPTFSESSYGFRPKRSAHQALNAACGYVKDGHIIVVDIDLEKFFDRVNHDVLMSRLARRIGDKRLLRLIRWYLQAGMFKNGIELAREEGTPQGGPLSPLLANLLLDELDKELERRGHRFCRYADDCNIYVKSQQAGERVMQSVTEFLEKRLRLKVNKQKSAVAHVEERQFLGHRLLRGGRLGISSKAIKKVKGRLREITGRHRGLKFEKVVAELNAFTIGWTTYYRYALVRSLLRELDSWIKQRLRCFRMVQCKRKRRRMELLTSLGVHIRDAWFAARYCSSPWPLSRKPAVKLAMSDQWFSSIGLRSLVQRYDALRV
jgi:RNA-directed DNA polymerase